MKGKQNDGTLDKDSEFNRRMAEFDKRFTNLEKDNKSKGKETLLRRCYRELAPFLPASGGIPVA